MAEISIISSIENNVLAESAKKQLKGVSRFLFFDDKEVVLASSFPVEPSEMKGLAGVVDGRDDAVRNGLVLQGTRFEVHRHHPPLVYGRTMGGEPEKSEGVAFCKVSDGLGGIACYGVITYQMPYISARMVPLLQGFCLEHLQQAGPTAVKA